MARKKINYYKFTPGVTGVGTVQLPDQYTLDDILMITNVTRNTVIYNFGDPNRGAYNAASGGTGPVISFDGSDTNTTFAAGVAGLTSAYYNGVTTLFLRFDTSTHSANDVLQIYVESDELKIRTHDFGIDAVERQRIGVPRSMIDADFEYGLQSTKWASFTTYRQTPTTYAMDGTDFSVNAFAYVTMVASDANSTINLGQAITAAAMNNIPNGPRGYTVNNQGNVYIINSPQTPGFATPNLAYPAIASQMISNAPIHNLGEYKLVINQPSGVAAGQSWGPANATNITKNRPITQANGGQFQRTFGVASTSQFLVGDVIAAIGLPRFDQYNYVTGAEVLATESFGFTAAGGARGTAGTSYVSTLGFSAGTIEIKANTFLAVEYGGLNSNLFELIHVNAPIATGSTINAALNVLGTNPANTFVAGGRIYCLTPGGVVYGSNYGAGATPNSSLISNAQNLPSGQPGVINSIEMMRVDAINTTTNELTVTRGWFGTNANVSFGPGTIIAPVNLRPGFTYAQWLANVEISKVAVGSATAALSAMTTSNAQVSGFPTTAGALPLGTVVNYLTPDFPMMGYGAANVTYTGSGMGGTAGIRAGSFVVTLSGMFQAGNTSVPLVMISANNHSISQFTGANLAGGTGSNISNCWISTIATTGSYNNANVEGVFYNQISDKDYLAFFPKNADASKYPGYPLIPPNEITTIAPRFKRGGLYMGANLLHAVGNIQVTSNTAGVAGTTSVANILVRTQNPHGILPGTPIQVSFRGWMGKGTLAGAGTIGNPPYNGTSANILASGVATVTHANLYYFSYLSKSVSGNPMDATGATAGPGGTGTLTVNGNLSVWAFPTSQVKHRGLDGGTNIGINVPSYGFEATRQTRKYFRYQSGKGMMFTTGTQFNPVFSVANVAANVTALASNPGITIQTVNEHGLQRGANIKLYGLNTVGYNDYYTVNQVQGPYVFSVMAKTQLGGLNPTSTGANIGDYSYNPRVTVTNWHGAKIRSGMFDDGNGVFWEYDGQYLWAVKRSATYELPGSVSLAPGDNRVMGDTNTRFTDNLKQGDMIQIRGMVHDVIHVESNNVFYITPAYRGTAPAVNANYSLIREQRTRSALFNMDKLDGTGPSGYVIDLSKMQMVGIQYTWYGAGFIDWGMRTTDGRMIWAHRVKNNNRNDEGYMRSGNLPARYQAVNRGTVTWLTTSVNTTDTTFRVANIDEFPTSVSASFPGYALVDSELISFTGVTNLGITGGSPQGTLTGITRAAEYKPVILNEARSIRGEIASAHTANVSPVILYSITASPDLNHWGSAVILDGDFDVDRTYQFAYAVNNVTYAAAQLGVPQTIFMIRLSPSIGSGIPADLGGRDLLNRAQLLLQNCYVNLGTSQARVLLQGIVNPINVEWANWQNVNNAANQYAPSFAQFVSNVSPVTRGGLDGGINSHVSQIKWSSSVTSPAGAPGAFPVQVGGASGPFVVPYAYGGEQLFSIPISATNSGFVDLSKVKEVGGTIIPGNQVYPNGPEIIAFNIVPISSTSSAIDLQLTWIESQA